MADGERAPGAGADSCAAGELPNLAETFWVYFLSVGCISLWGWLSSLLLHPGWRQALNGASYICIRRFSGGHRAFAYSNRSMDSLPGNRDM